MHRRNSVSAKKVVAKVPPLKLQSLKATPLHQSVLEITLRKVYSIGTDVVKCTGHEINSSEVYPARNHARDSVAYEIVPEELFGLDLRQIYLFLTFIALEENAE